MKIMKMIQTKNGRWLLAEEKPGPIYLGQHKDGKSHPYSLDKLRQVADIPVDQEEDQQQKKGEGVELIHYLHDHGEYVTRNLTTTPSESLAACYEQSLRDKRPVSDIFAVRTGDYHYVRFQKRLIEKGYNFTMQIIANKDLAHIKRKDLIAKINKSNFAWAGATEAFFLRVDGCEGFGLEMLGISIKHAKKSSKRLQEVARLAVLSLVMENGEVLDFTMPEVKNVTGDRDGLTYDGRSYVRKSFVLRMNQNTENPADRIETSDRVINGSMVELSARLDGDGIGGEMKGTFTIVPNSQIPSDIVTHHTNIKPEMITEGYTMVTAWEHEPWHPAIWNTQFQIMLDHAMPESAIIADLHRQVQMFRDVIESGILPPALTRGEKAHDDTAVPVGEQLSDTVTASWLRWPVEYRRAAQNLIYMMTNGWEKRMDGDKVRGFHKKNWILMSNAVLMSVVTWESATRLGGFKFPGRNRHVAFWDDRIGFVMPAYRFVQGARYHGGHDQDDQEVALIVKVWCSDPAVLDIHKGKTIPGGLNYPSKMEDARTMVLMMRSPMGPGEWTLEVCDIDTLPIPPEQRHDDIRVIDIAKMPLPADVMAKNVTVTGIPEGVYTKKEMTRKDGLEMIEAQMSNPTVGAICNPMMVRSSIKGGFPDVMLEQLETMIDELNQGSNKAAFEAIAEESETMLEDVYGCEVDRALAMTRIGNPFVRNEFRMVIGRHFRLEKEYVKAIETIREELRMNSLQVRLQQPIIQHMINTKFPAPMMAWAAGFYLKYEMELANINAKYSVQLEGEENAVKKLTLQYYRKTEMEAVVQEMVDFFLDIEDDKRRYNHVIGLWGYIVTPQPDSTDALTRECGLFDRIIFQPNKGGSICVMDILIEALDDRGLIPHNDEEEEEVMV